MQPDATKNMHHRIKKNRKKNMHHLTEKKAEGNCIFFRNTSGKSKRDILRMVATL